jgi:hypothetical protein
VATGRGDRLPDGVRGVEAAVERGPEAGQHQQGVVDPHADADQPGHHRGPLRYVEYAGQNADHRRGHAQTEQRHCQRQPHRHQRPERDQQHHHGAEQAEHLGGRPALGLADRPSCERHLEAGAARLLGVVDEPLSSVERHLRGRPVELQASHRDRAVARHLRLLRGRDSLEPLGLGDEAVHPLAHRRSGGAAGRLPHHVDGLGREPAEMGGHDLPCGVRVRPGRRIVGAELAGDARRDGQNGHQQDEPAGQDETAAAVGERGEAMES